MKNKILIFIFFISIKNFSQENFLKSYKIFSTNSCTKLLKDSKKMFADFYSKEKKEISKKFKIDSIFKYATNELVNGKKVVVYKTIIIDSTFIKKQFIIESKPVENVFSFNAHVLLKPNSNKLIVNPVGTDKNYYFLLKSGFKFKLNFSEWTVSAITIPIKYRFKQKVKDKKIEEDFTSGINLNFFIGRSYGKTNFMYRKGVKNKINTWKISGGLIVGTSTILLNSSNTSIADNPLINKEISKGLFSMGFGAAYSFNVINFGLFYGWDYTIGENAKKWNYNKKPWLGIAVGYSLLKF